MGIIFEHIRKYLIENVWTDKNFLKQMGKEWIDELHFETKNIEFETNHKNSALATSVWIYIPLPNQNDGWTKNSFKLAENLIKHLDGYYDWAAQFDYNTKVNKDKNFLEQNLYLAVCVPNPN